jgi:hypothetical protein
MMKSAIVVGVLVSLVSIAAAKPIKPVQLNAYDANGKKIGRVLDMSGTSRPLSEAKVPVRISGTIFVLNVQEDALDTYGPPLVFETTDCTGTPYLIPQGGDLLESGATVAAPGWTIYAQQPGEPERLITIQSQRRTGPCTLSNAPDVSVFPAVPLIDLSTLFAAPFSVH